MGAAVGAAVGEWVSPYFDGAAVGASVGEAVGASVGACVSPSFEGAGVGTAVGAGVGTAVGAGVPTHMWRRDTNCIEMVCVKCGIVSSWPSGHRHSYSCARVVLLTKHVAFSPPGSGLTQQ